MGKKGQMKYMTLEAWIMRASFSPMGLKKRWKEILSRICLQIILKVLLWWPTKEPKELLRFNFIYILILIASVNFRFECRKKGLKVPSFNFCQKLLINILYQVRCIFTLGMAFNLLNSNTCNTRDTEKMEVSHKKIIDVAKATAGESEEHRFERQGHVPIH